MPLENLVSTIETLKERIKDHRSYLRAKEARTRVVLIDPILQSLEWDTANPNLVRVEETLRAGRADYALYASNDSLVAVIEAKALGSQLDNVTDQLVRYAFTEGVPYAISTDGDMWHVYDLTKPNVHIDERLIVRTSISSDPVHECALKLLFLWHLNLASKSPIQANMPIVSAPNDVPLIAKPDPIALPDEFNSVNTNWMSLATCDPEKGTKGPTMVRFPDGSEKSIFRKSWNRLFVEIVMWLNDNKLLNSANIPVEGSDDESESWFVLNSKPEYGPGDPFRYHRKLDTTPPLYFDTDVGSGGFVYRTKRVLEHCNQDPAEVYILPR